MIKWLYMGGEGWVSSELFCSICHCRRVVCAVLGTVGLYSIYTNVRNNNKYNKMVNAILVRVHLNMP